MLRLIVRQQRLANGYQLFANDALSAISLKASVCWASAAARVLVAFRVAQVDPARPHVTLPKYLWRHITARLIQALYERIVEVLLPNATDRVGVSGLMHTGIQIVAVDQT